MKIYKIEDGYEGYSINDDPPDPHSPVEEFDGMRVVKIEDYLDLEERYVKLLRATDSHQRMFYQLCLERDALQRRLTEKQKALEAAK